MASYQQFKERLLELSESKYAEFSAKLLPGTQNIIGVRLPLLRIEAKKIVKENRWQEYLEVFNKQYELSRETVYFEEIMLAGMIIGELKPENKQSNAKAQEISLQDIFILITDFIPKINNWSVCDSFCAGLKLAKKYPDKFWNFILPYIESSHEYDLRFAIVMMLNYYIEETYIDKVIHFINTLCLETYYVKMAAAWCLSKCYIKFPSETLEYLNSNHHLDNFTYNKTLQKIIESLQVSKEDKIKLRAMKR